MEDLKKKSDGMWLRRILKWGRGRMGRVVKEVADWFSGDSVYILFFDYHEYLEIKFDEWRKNLKVRKIFISLHNLDEATSDEREEFPQFLLPCIFWEWK